MMQTSLARKLRLLRAGRGLSLRDAASLCGVTKETLSALERGVREPHDPTLAKIARGYGVPIEDLLIEEEPTEETFPPKAERRPEQSPLSRRTLPTPETVVGSVQRTRRANTLDEIDADAPRLLRETYGHAILNRTPEELSKETDPAQIGTFIVYVDKEFRWLRRHYKNRRDTESLWQSKERRRQLDHLYQQHMEVLTDALSRVVPLQTADLDKEPANQ